MTRGTLIQSALLLAVIATAGVVAMDCAPAAEQHIQDAHLVGGGSLSRPLLVGQGKALVYDFPRDIRNVMVGDPNITKAVILSARRANIIGVAPGTGTITFFDAEGRQMASFDITVFRVPVARDVTIIRDAIRRLIPNAYVNVESIGDGIILTGTVATPLESQLAYDIASHFVAPADAWSNAGSVNSNTGPGTVTSLSQSGGPSLPSANALNGASASKVVNAIVVRGRDQVLLKVTVAEIDRTIIKQLGINLNGGIGFGSSVLNFNTANPFPVNGQLSNINPFAVNGSTLLSNATCAIAPCLATPPNSPAGITGTFRSVTANLQAMDQAGVIRTLAEPTLICDLR